LKDYTAKFEAIERKEWTEVEGKAITALQEWTRKYERAKTYRVTCGWEKAAEDALKIRKNDLPLREIQGLQNWKGKHYKDSWLWKSIKLQVSMLTGSALDIDLKSYGGIVTPDQDLLEQEVNYAHDAFDFMNAYEDALYDSRYPGMGWVRLIWNTRKTTPNYPTGTPKSEHVSTMNVIIDETTRQRDKSDMRYLFHEDYIDLVELRRRYPKYKDKIQESITENNLDATGRGHVVTLQYRKTIELEKVYIEDRDTGQKSDFLLDEWIDYIAKEAGKPENETLYQQYVQQQSAQDPALEQETLEYNQWLMEGGTLPEKVVMIGSVSTEEDAVFQAIYMPEMNLVLEPPQYIGKTFSYICLPGIHEPDCAYSYGICHYMADLQEASTIIMTMLLVTATKVYRNKELIAEDSLVNQEQYQEDGYKIGVNPIVKDEWQKRHGENALAIRPIPLPEFPQALSFLNEQITNAQKTFAGATDAMMGLQSYSGDSGIKVAQLQSASRTYQREDIETYRRFIKSCVEWLKDQIVMFRNYPHQIQGLDQEDKPGMVDVATDIKNRLNADSYYVSVTLQDNQEVVKQIEREIAQNMFDRGLSSDVDYLRDLDRPNPEKQAENAAIYRGDKKYIDAIKANPQLAQMIDQFLQQAQNPQPAQPQAQ
jgi:hypothetical protein